MLVEVLQVKLTFRKGSLIKPDSYSVGVGNSSKAHTGTANEVTVP